jgi:phage/plasmid-like protein (TIGR03299 family)
VTTKTDVVDNIDAAINDNEVSDDANGDDAQPVPQPSKRRRTKSNEADVAPPVEPYSLKAFSTREVPWMKIGAIAETAHTAADAAEAGGLNFEVELLDAGFRSSVKPKVGTSPWKTIPARRACVRVDTQQFFSFVSSTYAPVQYGDAFAFMDEISPEYVAAGTLGGGRQGFMVVKLADQKPIELGIGKQVDTFDQLRTSHDLTRAIEVSVMMLRDKCMNALTLSSFTQGAQQRWSVKHVGKDPMKKLAAATTTLARSNAYAESFIKTAQELAAIKLEMEDATAMLKRILPDRPKRDEQVNAIVHAWRQSPTNGFPDNGWGLVNAVSEYFEWGRNEGTRTDQSRFTGGLTGSTHRFTNRTAQLLLQRRR